MAAINEDDDTKSLLNRNTSTNKKTKQTKKKKKTFCQWLFSNPFSKLPFFYFVVGIVAVPVLAIYHLMDPDVAFIICGAFLTLNIFGLKHFHTLIALKKEVDNLGCLNKRFGAEHGKLSIEVSRISAANTTLRNARNRIQSANVQNRENLSQFGELQETMKKLNLKSVEELQSIVEKANGIGDSWQKQLVEHERNVLHTVFDRFELRSGKNGMTQQEFVEFSAELPETYQTRFARLGIFEKISADGKLVKFSDFEVVLDLFAEMDAFDCDIDFSIEKTGDDGMDAVDDEYEYLPQSTLRVIPSSEDWGDISDMKRWKTQRKIYDDVQRKIVVHAKHFVSGKAKSFTSSLGFNVIDDVKSDADEEEDDDKGYFGFDRKTSKGLGRMEKSASYELRMAARMESTDDK